MVLALLLAAVPAMKDSVAFEYRPLGEEGAAFRTVERTSLLTGRMEFSARVQDPERSEVCGLDVLAEGMLLDGRPAKLCTSTDGAACTADFGPEIRGYRLTMVARVRARGDTSAETTVQRRVTTLLAGTAGAPASLGGPSLVESTTVESHPQDQVTRAVLVRAGKKPLLDLTERDFVAGVQGIGKVRVLAARAPHADAACLVPVLLEASPYVRRSATGAARTRSTRPARAGPAAPGPARAHADPGRDPPTGGDARDPRMPRPPDAGTSTRSGGRRAHRSRTRFLRPAVGGPRDEYLARTTDVP